MMIAIFVDSENSAGEMKTLRESERVPKSCLGLGEFWLKRGL